MSDDPNGGTNLPEPVPPAPDNPPPQDPDAPQADVGPGPMPPLPSTVAEGPPLPPIDLPSDPADLTPEVAAQLDRWVELHSASARVRVEQAEAELRELRVQAERLKVAKMAEEATRARIERMPPTPSAAYLESAPRKGKPHPGDAPPPPGWDPRGGGEELPGAGPMSKLSPQEQTAVEMWLNARPKLEIARHLDISLNTLNTWLARPHVREAQALQYADLTRLRVERLRRYIDQAMAHAEGILDADPNAPGLPPEVAAAIIESKDKMTAIALSRIKPFTLADLTATAGDAGFATEQQWERQYLQVGDVIVPHRSQRKVLASKARFVVVVAGVQSGKTFVAAILFWKRIREWYAQNENRRRRGMFWLVAPNSIIGRIMCERFTTLAPPGWITGYNASDQIWTLKDGSRVQFRSGEHADQLVADTLDGVWLDEFPICKPDVWRVSLRARIATTGGFVVFSGSPRGRNWAYQDVWLAGIPGSDKYDPTGAFECFTWYSEENPSIPPEEIASAKRDLPAAVYRREWQASWDAFHGQIYEDWNEARMVLPLDDAGRPTDRCERGTIHVMGIDWGYRAAGCLLVVRIFPDDTYEVVEEVYEANRLDDWWDERIEQAWARWRCVRIWADPEGASRIATLQEAGMPIEGAHNEVMQGIRAVSAVVRSDRIRVTRQAANLIAQMSSYRWKEVRGSSQEVPEAPEKGNDHAVDPLRYVIFSEMTKDLTGEERISYGGRKLSSKRGRGVERRG